MRPMIDDLELPQVQVIDSRDHRDLVEHLPPGSEGSLLQDLGREATWVALRGLASGVEARRVVERLGEKLRRGEPLPFTADIVTSRGLEAVLIEDLRLRELAGKPDRFAYVLILREYLEPPAVEDVSFLNDEILADATSLVDNLVTGLDLGLGLLTGLERFVSPLEEMTSELSKSSGR